jgi:TRAP-type C4-dicarboxylate transport system substrate-binding protein
MRQEILKSLCDEDFELINVDPATVSDDEFAKLVDEMQKFLDETFSAVLETCWKNVKRSRSK